MLALFTNIVRRYWPSRVRALECRCERLESELVAVWNELAETRNVQEQNEQLRLSSDLQERRRKTALHNESLDALSEFASQVICQLESPRGQFSASKANNRLQSCIEELRNL